jgi:glycolate oxidase FAD binding subunit
MNSSGTASLEVEQPASAAEVGDTVRRAGAAGMAVYPCGGRTKLDLGVAPTRSGILLDLRRLDQVIDYPARDMTVTVQAGMTMARLNEILAAEKQRLPIDVARASAATVGGCLSANVSGPRRYGWGTLRDYLIGFSAINDDGDEFKAGGRVVKNVAGYDICKLMVGSLGTLGAMTQATFKLRPAVEEQALFAFPCPPDQVTIALDLLHGSKTRPVCIELLNPAAAEALSGEVYGPWQAQWSIVVGFESNADALHWQVKQLMAEIACRWVFRGALGLCTSMVWRALTEFPSSGLGYLSFKATMLPSAVAQWCLEAERVLAPVQMIAHAGNGCVHGHCLGEESARGKECLERMRQLAVTGGGSLFVERCPLAWKTAEFVWGPPRPDWELMRALKNKVDSRGLFSPGRFVGGL